MHVTFEWTIKMNPKHVALCAGLLLMWLPCAVSAAGEDFVQAERTAQYCRGDVERPIALTSDQQNVCIDGWISATTDLAALDKLSKGGMAVVRSEGGDLSTLIAIAEILRERQTTVVIVDHCLFTCANILFIASSQTVVLKNSMVAWRAGANSSECLDFVAAKDKGPSRLDSTSCSKDATSTQTKPVSEDLQRFYDSRFADAQLEFPPQSDIVRTALKGMAQRTNSAPKVAWTWNPRYLNKIKTQIIYEAYPRSQAEVDALATRLHLVYPVIFDP